MKPHLYKVHGRWAWTVYGKVKAEGASFELIMNSIANQLTEMEVGENEYHDIPVKKRRVW